jgi:hypothetical protein
MRRDVKPKAWLEMPGQRARQTSGTAAEVKGIVTSEWKPEPRRDAQQGVDRVPTILQKASISHPPRRRVGADKIAQ